MRRFYDAKQLNLREGHVKQIVFFDKKKKAKQRLVQTITVEYSFSPFLFVCEAYIGVL